ncbi:acylneuraminate cytidylyltransferase [Candidatus Microgenomates bacterium]|nr:MAG: acylneuraminate cytidylyltransferase [Candidatus Microgenomates bacterium]
MNFAAIIQARMNSSRLYAKVKKKIVGHPVLWHVVERAKRIKPLSQVIVATSTKKENNWIRKFCEENNIICFSGSEDDVLDRYFKAAQSLRADAVIRITGDCPLLDPTISSKVVREFIERSADIGGLDGEFPHGYDTEVFTFSALQKAHEQAQLPSDREHVTKFLLDRPQEFHFSSTVYKNTISHLTFALDQNEDYIFLNKIFIRLFTNDNFFGMRTVEKLLHENPYLIKPANMRDGSQIGLKKSLAADTKYLQKSS